MKQLLYFHADWCPPCRFYANIVIKPLEEKIGKNLIQWIDVQEKPALAEKYFVDKLPTVVIVNGEEILLNHYGSLALEVLENFFKE